jgi:hypothetical protein
MKTKRVTCRAFTKAVDLEARTAEQIVSVFNNVDYGKDRVNFGAFAETLAKWNNSANVLPAYFSHKWDDPFSNIAAVIYSEELAPGDERLPDDEIVTDDGKTVRDLGGLLVKYQFDDAGINPTGDFVLHLLDQRRIYQASFAYDIEDQKRNSDGTNDLLKLSLIEVGPTLLGMNSATTLLASKSIEQLAKDSGLTEDQVTAVVNAAEKDIIHSFIASEEDATKCAFCGKTMRAMAHIMRLSDDNEHGTKSAGVSFTGSYEERQRALLELGRGWALSNDVGNGGFYCIYLEATYADRAVFLVEGWNDPYGEGLYYETSIIDNADGSISISDPLEVVVEATVVPKRRQKNLDSTTRRKTAATIEDQDEGKITETANPEASNGNGEGDNPEVETTSEDDAGEAERLQLEAEAMLLEAG